MKRLARFLVVLAAAAAVLASHPGHGASAVAVRPEREAAAPEIALETLATGLTPVTAITHAGDRRLFVTLQRGQVVIWDGTEILPGPFLDVSSLISCCGERGLLSTAFHPQYAVNGFFFIDYTDLNGDTVVARYRVSSNNRNAADPFSGVILLTIAQPAANHNGGQLQFGPDGFLYIGMGDGGSANDPNCNAQKSDTLLGKMLRIDVDKSVGQPPYYGIPLGNPYLARGGPPEAWAFGLRNPWRFSFDRLTGDLLIGDVGQGAREEIDYQPRTSHGGENYGWKLMEGTICGAGGNAGCPAEVPPCGDPAYTLPILEYSHDAGNCAVTGGYVSRGLSIPGLYGKYVYGDFCSGQIRAASLQAGSWSSQLLSIEAPSLATFGEDVFGELYVGTGGSSSGTLSRIVAAVPVSPTIDTIQPSAGLARGGETVTITGTNFTGRTAVLFGGVPAAVEVQNPTLLVAVAPAHLPGLVDVLVANPGASPAIRVLGYGYLPIPRVPPAARTPRVVERP